MSRVLRNRSKSTKTTRCSCCDNSNNQSKGSLLNRSVSSGQQEPASKRPVERRNVQKISYSTNNLSHPKSTNVKKNKNITKRKDQISNKKIVHVDKKRKVIKSAVGKEHKECVVQLVRLNIEDLQLANSKKAQHKNGQNEHSLKKGSQNCKRSKNAKLLPEVYNQTTKLLKSEKLLENDNLLSCERESSNNEKQQLKDCYVKLNRDKLIEHRQMKQLSNMPIKDCRYSKDSRPSPNEHTQNSVLHKKLRSRKPVKYADSSLEITKCEDKMITKKVPIYQQNTSEGKPNKKNDDQYEFDSDSEKRKKRKRPKLDSSTPDNLNKTMRNILKNIANKEAKKKRKIIFSDMNKRKMTKPNLIIKNNNNLVKYKTKETTNMMGGKTTFTKTKNQNQNLGDKLMGTSLIRPYVFDNVILTSTPKINILDKNNAVFKKPDIANFTSVDKEKEDADVYDATDVPDIRSDGSDSEEEYFVPITNKIDSPTKVKILSDVQLKPWKELNLSIASPRMFKDGQPNANSTALNNVLTPWRFSDINIKRNPHFIAIKPSSLPYVNQDMVLDYTIVDKLNDTSKSKLENVSEQEHRNFAKKSLTQGTLNNYIKCNNENKENKENATVSLFDNDQLSPIKSISRTSGSKNDVKRRILGEINENVIEDPPSMQGLSESPLKESVDMEKSNDDNTNFGFDSIEEELDEQNAHLRKKDDRPFRLSVNMHDKKYLPKRKIKVKKVESFADESSSSSDNSDVENEQGEIKLFEEFDNTQEVIEKLEEKTGLVRKIRRNKDLQKQKKRKDVRSKEEEEEAEKWAAAFNSMCEEIEQFPLEIE